MVIRTNIPREGRDFQIARQMRKSFGIQISFDKRIYIYIIN